MASLIKSIKFATNLVNKNHSPILIFTRNHWNKDFKPAPYPITEKERDAAAKKYNVHPKEYEPYPDNGLGFGDYPKLPDTCVEQRDPYYPYDNPEHKRNFNEAIHVEIDLIGEDRYGSPEPLRWPMKNYFLSFGGVMAAFFILYYALESHKMHPPVLAKHYPADGRSYYTFELEESNKRK